MIHKKSILFFILLFYFGCLDNGHAPPPPFPEVSLSASESSIEVDSVFTLYVNVDNIKELFAISFEIMYDPTFLEVVSEIDHGDVPPTPFPMDSWFVEYSDSYTEDNFFGPIVYLDTLGVISVAFSGNNINGNIISFTIKGIQATVLDTENDGNSIPDYTTLQLDKEKINLIQIDNMIVSDIKLTDLIVRAVTITVTDE